MPGLPNAARPAIIRRDVADPAGQPLTKEIAIVVTSPTPRAQSR